jgi:hypothetical protein
LIEGVSIIRISKTPTGLDTHQSSANISLAARR